MSGTQNVTISKFWYFLRLKTFYTNKTFIFTFKTNKMNNSTEIKTCPGCQEEFDARRLNQKFCTVKCKSRFHNRHSNKLYESKERARLTKIWNDAIWNNRQILVKYLNQEMRMDELIAQGFKKNYICFFNHSKELGNILFCYDLCYYFTDKTQKIIKIQKYEST